MSASFLDHIKFVWTVWTDLQEVSLLLLTHALIIVESMVTMHVSLLFKRRSSYRL